jgi:hypothetical protein
MVVPRWYFFDDLHERLPENRYFEKGRYKLGSTNCRTATFVGEAFTQRQISLLIDHGINVPRYFTIREIEGTVTFSADVKVCITYTQDIRALNEDCSTLESLNDAQMILLSNFMRSADQFFGAH